MCGICGIVSKNRHAPVDGRLLDDMTGALRHRGPDGAGRYVNGCVGLGHRRLSIIDISGGAQPICNEDASVVIVFNGEIYNYKELRHELVQRGHRFKTQSDTEVIVHLYEDFGDDCLHSLNGMFAFAIWDGRRERLIAARDRLGEKPLYYFERDGQLIFASELKALLCDPRIPRRISVAALDDYLAYGYVPAPRTILDGVHKLAAGHRLVWEHGRLCVSRYWSLMAGSGAPPHGEHECVDGVRALLEDSVRLRLRSDVRVGAFLSGGIDSSLIVALACRIGDEPLDTFSVGFSEQDFDELRYARQIAQRYRTRHHEIFVRDVDFDIFPRLVAHFDEPIADSSVVPVYYVTREARRFVKVCLSGDGGDELFGGYPQYHWEELEPTLLRVPQRVRAAWLERIASRLPDHFHGKGWLRRMAASGAVRYQRKLGVFDSVERHALFRREYSARIDKSAWLFRPYYNVDGQDEIAIRMRTDQGTYLPENILVKVDRNSMMHGLEVRVPFLDHRLVEFANSLPLDLKIRGDESKHVLRRLLASLAPESIASRTKQGFGLPIRRWLHGPLADVARDLLLSGSTRCTQFLRRDALMSLLHAHGRGRRDLSHRIWALLWFEQWCREFGI